MLGKEFAEEFNCLVENTEKYKTFSVPITKEVKTTDKNGKETSKTIYYKLQFIHSMQFMTSLLSNLVDDLAEGIRQIKCKHGYDNKSLNVQLYSKIVSVVLNTETLKMI